MFWIKICHNLLQPFMLLLPNFKFVLLSVGCHFRWNRRTLLHLIHLQSPFPESRMSSSKPTPLHIHILSSLFTSSYHHHHHKHLDSMGLEVPNLLHLYHPPGTDDITTGSNNQRLIELCLSESVNLIFSNQNLL